jgi:lipoprotein-releasing system ATP-binding protein
MLEAIHLQKKYQQREVLSGVSLQVDKGDMVAIMGASGAGKSTLLHILSTLDTPDAGTVQLEGVTLHNLKGKALASFRNRRLGFVFQHHNLLPEFTALENMVIPALIAGTSFQAAAVHARELAERLDIIHVLSQKPSQLSGGEQQRVAMARALINKPSILFADEPTGNLDAVNADLLHNLLLDLKKALNQTIVVVTHTEALSKLADRTVYMIQGKLHTTP